MTHPDQSRRNFLKSTGLCAASMALPKCGSSKRPRKPNILFIMSDDHAAQALSCYGSVLATTPNIDRIANEGMRFDNCFCTNSLCAPSRAVILTGKYSHINGVIDNRVPFDGNQQTFPMLLQQHGYQTAIVGKWHLKSAPTGFDYWNVLPGQGKYYNPTLIEMGIEKEHPGYISEIITNESLRWLQSRDPSKPFLLLCHHKAAHMPWRPAEKFANAYTETRFPYPETFNDDYTTRSDALRVQGLTIEHHLNNWMKWKVPAGVIGQARKNWLFQKFLQQYLSTAKSIDESVGRLLDYIDDAGLVNNTVVIYTSDQGFFLGEHGIFDKRFMYEESIRMPLVMRYPGLIAASAANKDIVLNLDFAPTLLDLAGAKIPADMQGQSLRPLLKSHTPKNWRQAMYYHYYEQALVPPQFGIRTQRYKLIHFYDLQSENNWEMFDLEKDPHEVKNLYDNTEYAFRIGELKKELSRLQKLYGDQIE